MNKPVYVVSGMQRSGTSMMMVALHKGGMDAVWDESRNKQIQERLGDDKCRNCEHAFSEHSSAASLTSASFTVIPGCSHTTSRIERGVEYLSPCPCQEFQGYVVNAAGLHELSSKEYQQRPDFPVGYEGRLIKALQMGPGRMIVMPGGIKVVWMWRDPEEVRQSYQALMGRDVWTREEVIKLQRRSQAAIVNRRDSLIHCVNFRELVDNPRPNFERIAAFLNRPLDIDAMVAHVDASQVRYKEEELVAGIV